MSFRTKTCTRMIFTDGIHISNIFCRNNKSSSFLLFYLSFKDHYEHSQLCNTKYICKIICKLDALIFLFFASIVKHLCIKVESSVSIGMKEREQSREYRFFLQLLQESHLTSSCSSEAALRPKQNQTVVPLWTDEGRMLLKENCMRFTTGSSGNIKGN